MREPRVDVIRPKVEKFNKEFKGMLKQPAEKGAAK